MPSNINIDNQGPSIAQISTSVSPILSSSYWGVAATSAPAEQTTKILWMDRDEGITRGDTWVFTSSFTFQGVAIQLLEALTGTATASTLKIQIVAGSQNTGFQSNDTGLTFKDGGGATWKINGHFFLNGSYDDVTYTISPQ
ncbi:MAG: hypothetical protein U0441_17255 [Polyangiaceae bacterium]